MYKGFAAFFLLFCCTFVLAAADLFDFNVGMTKHQLMNEALAGESDAVREVSAHLVTLDVAASKKYARHNLDGAFTLISFYLDHEERIYKIRLESDPQKRRAYIQYEYIYNGLHARLKQDQSPELETDSFVVLREGEGGSFTTYYLETSSTIRERRLHEYLKDDENRRLYTLSSR